VDLRLPIVATIAGAAVLAAAFRTLHHEPASGPSPDGGVMVVASAPPRFAPARTPSARVTVYVAGEVAHAGVYTVPATDRAVDALAVAGGATHGADLVAINLAEPVSDGEEIVVPAEGAEPPVEATSTSARKRSHAGHKKKRRRKHRAHAARRNAASDTVSEAGSDAAGSEPPTEVVDLNTADENELETLPGIGPSLAGRIVAFRELNGPYASADDLLDVGGMTQGRLDAISDYVTTAPR
jgi:competence protein ComEA